MSRDTGDHKLLNEMRANIVERLRSRRSEIVQAIYDRVRDAVPDPVDNKSAEYQAGMRAAVLAVFDYSLEGIKGGPEWSGSIPTEAAAQAHRAARYGVSLGTILRRYVAGHGRLGEFVGEEAALSGLSNDVSVLQHLRRTQEMLLERITAAIEREYEQELDRVGRSPQQHRMEMVKRLLSGDVVDPSELADLNYEFNAPWHLGLIATGIKIDEALRKLNARVGHKLLRVSRDDETVWAWLGGLRKLSVADVEQLLSANGTGVLLAIGEPGRGIHGWRQTHLEAQIALPVALRKPKRLTRCADVLPEAAVLQNEAMVRLLIKTYLVPLNSLRKNGETARETLRAYFTHERKVSCAATALKVARRTVENRLHEIENVLGRPLHTCLAGLEIALRLEELGYAVSADDGNSALSGLGIPSSPTKLSIYVNPMPDSFAYW
ncbi:MAG TPA: helix-turn-helix domain-containing protein [Solirubrobacteraceae bacterium]|jgi:hypothetical protein